jgi:hypothetical protein
VAVDKQVVRVLVGDRFYEVADGSYSTKKSGTDGFTFTDRHSGRVVSGPLDSVIAVESQPKK